MEINETKHHDIEKLYINFLYNTVVFYNDRLKFVKPENMYEEHCNREKILSVSLDFCGLISRNIEIFMDIFKEWSIYLSVDNAENKEQIDDIFDFLANLQSVSLRESFIKNWYGQIFLENAMLIKMDIYELSAEEITKDKNITNILSEPMINIEYMKKVKKEWIKNDVVDIKSTNQELNEKEEIVSVLYDIIMFFEKNTDMFFEFFEHYVMNNLRLEKHINLIFRLNKILSESLFYVTDIEKWEHELFNEKQIIKDDKK